MVIEDPYLYNDDEESEIMSILLYVSYCHKILKLISFFLSLSFPSSRCVFLIYTWRLLNKFWEIFYYSPHLCHFNVHFFYKISIDYWAKNAINSLSFLFIFYFHFVVEFSLASSYGWSGSLSTLYVLLNVAGELKNVNKLWLKEKDALDFSLYATVNQLYSLCYSLF